MQAVAIYASAGLLMHLHLNMRPTVECTRDAAWSAVYRKFEKRSIQLKSTRYIVQAL